MHDAQPIPEQIPNQRLLEKHHVPIIEDIGQPTTACFFTKNTIEPMKWYFFPPLPFSLFCNLWILIKQFPIQMHTHTGGCLRNMMECEDSGIHRNNVSSPAQANELMFQWRLFNPCPPTSSWMGEIWCCSIPFHFSSSIPDMHAHTCRFGRNNFQEAIKLAHSHQLPHVDWFKFKFMVFDVPTHKGTFEERYSTLGLSSLKMQKTKLADDLFLTVAQFGIIQHKHVEIAPMIVAKDMNHLEQFLQNVLDNGGEGIILRDPKCHHQGGRSSGFLKHKVGCFCPPPTVDQTDAHAFAEIQGWGSKNCATHPSFPMGM
jgi:hypothetical protein